MRTRTIELHPLPTLAWMAICVGVLAGAAGAATFNPTFQNIGPGTGFDDDGEGHLRQAAVLDVLDHLEGLLVDVGSCDVLFQEVSSDQISGFTSVHTAFTDIGVGYRNGDAFEHLTTGADPDPVTPDITVRVHFDSPWYLGEAYCVGCGPDLRTHILSSMLRGLGLQSAFDASGASTIAPGVYTGWDRLLITGRGEPLLHVQSGTPALAVPASTLVDLDLGIRFNGTEATEALGEPPFLNVSDSFAPDTSLQYFQRGTTLAAAKELLEPLGDVRRRLTPVDVGALRDIGYEVDDVPADVVVSTLSDVPDFGDDSSVSALNMNPGFNGISLREAIAACNATPGPEIVRFSVSGTIQPIAQLPVFVDETGGIFIEADGDITIDGAIQDPAGDGIEIQYSHSLLRGLRFINFAGYAIAIRSYGFGAGNRVLGCWIGLDAAGNPGTGNVHGILIHDSASNVIGGTVASARNVIGALSGSGIDVVDDTYGATGNVIIGNYAGLGPNGNTIRATAHGIRVFGADDTLIGGRLIGGRNVIGRCSDAGISIGGSMNSKTHVIGNYIGTTANGIVGVANGGIGVVVTSRYVEIGGRESSLGNLISGGWDSGVTLSGESAREALIANNRIGLRPTAQALGNDIGIAVFDQAALSSIIDNVIAGNHGDGVVIGSAGNGLRFEGNRIGTDASDATDLGNGGDGISISASSFVTIGAPDSEGNFIAHNAGAGVRVSGAAAGNSIQNNSIHSNEGGGIVLENGANEGVAPPVIDSIDPLEGTAISGATVEFFADEGAQGRLFLARTFLMGTATFSLLEDLAAYEGMNLTATATTGVDGSTSEFSTPVPIDLMGPDVSLIGANPMTLEAGESYTEFGATAMDTVDGDLSNAIQISGTVNTVVPGDYAVMYSVSDSAGHIASATRTVTVVDTTAPVLTLNGPALVNVREGMPYEDDGATASDIVDGDLTGSIVVTGAVNTDVSGEYVLTYTVMDAAGNQSSRIRTVNVTELDVPNVTLEVAPIAASAGTPFQFTAAPDNPSGNYTYAWDFAGFGTSDAQNPIFVFGSVSPGSYEVELTVFSDDSEEDYSIFVTITDGPAVGVGRVNPDVETVITVDDGPLAGAMVVVPPGAVDEPVVIAIGEVSDPPPLLAGAVSQLLRLEPSGLQFNIPVTVRLRHPSTWYHQEDMEVLYYNVSASEWQDQGISNVMHVDVGAYHYVQYDTTHFTVFMAKSLVPSGIQGQVFSTTGDMLEGATVTIDPAGVNLVCDASGFYTTIADLPPGNYLVEADKPDTYCEDTETVVVGEAELVRQDFELLTRNSDGTCGNNGGGGGCHGSAPSTSDFAGDMLVIMGLLLALAAWAARQQHN